jgi:hypothetical protein
VTDSYDSPRPRDYALQQELDSLREQEREGHLTPDQQRRIEQLERRLHVDERGAEEREWGDQHHEDDQQEEHRRHRRLSSGNSVPGVGHLHLGRGQRAAYVVVSVVVGYALRLLDFKLQADDALHRQISKSDHA